MNLSQKDSEWVQWVGKGFFFFFPVMWAAMRQREHTDHHSGHSTTHGEPNPDG